jgi:hypothetical protein
VVISVDAVEVDDDDHQWVEEERGYPQGTDANRKIPVEGVPTSPDVNWHAYIRSMTWSTKSLSSFSTASSLETRFQTTPHQLALLAAMQLRAIARLTSSTTPRYRLEDDGLQLLFA